MARSRVSPVLNGMPLVFLHSLEFIPWPVLLCSRMSRLWATTRAWKVGKLIIKRKNCTSLRRNVRFLSQRPQREALSWLSHGTIKFLDENAKKIPGTSI